jgi:hypothetical protein
MKRGRAEAIIEEVQAAASRWPEFAEQANLGEEWRAKIAAHHRLKILA